MEKTHCDFHVADAEAMERLAGRLAAVVHEGLITLQGDLGAGKTTFVRGFLQAKGWRGPVKSPTYTLLESYQWDSHNYFHLDLYRLTDPDELAYLGMRELLLPDQICLVEWPEKGQGYLPVAAVAVLIAYQGEGREVTLFFEQPKMCHRFLQLHH